VEEKRWRVSLAGRLAGWTLVILGVATPVVATSYAFATQGWSGAGALFSFAFGLLAVGGWRGGLVPQVAATEAGVEIVNPLRRFLVAWTDVADITPGYFGLVIRRRSQKPVVAWAVQKANVSTWTAKHTRADDVAEELMRIAASHHRGPRSGLDLGLP
jgi:hypothetical protein